MIRSLTITFVAAATGLMMVGGIALASPEQDRQAMRDYYQQRFPDVAIEDYVNGSYALDAELRQQWKSLMEFPPYEFALEHRSEEHTSELQSRFDIVCRLL